MDRQVVRRLCSAAGILPLESHAGVEVLPEVSMTVDARAMSDHTAAVAHPTVRGILAAFGRAEAAVQKQDLDPLLHFYAKGSTYYALKPVDVRLIGSAAFADCRYVSSTHLCSDVKVFTSGSQLRAEITWIGGLYGTEAWEVRV